MFGPIFILPKEQVKAYHETLPGIARDVQLGGKYSGGPVFVDRLLNLTGDVLIRVGTYLKTDPPSSQRGNQPFDSCKGHA